MQITIIIIITIIINIYHYDKRRFNLQERKKLFTHKLSIFCQASALNRDARYMSSPRSSKMFCHVIHSTNHVTKFPYPSVDKGSMKNQKLVTVKCFFLSCKFSHRVLYHNFVNICIIIKYYYFFIRSSISIKICYCDDCLMPILLLAVSHVSTIIKIPGVLKNHSVCHFFS